MTLDGLSRQEQRVCDLRVRRPLRDEGRDFHLAASQHLAAGTRVGLATPPRPDAKLTQAALGEPCDRRCSHLHRAGGYLAERRGRATAIDAGQRTGTIEADELALEPRRHRVRAGHGVIQARDPIRLLLHRQDQTIDPGTSDVVDGDRVRHLANQAVEALPRAVRVADPCQRLRCAELQGMPASRAVGLGRVRQTGIDVPPHLDRRSRTIEASEPRRDDLMERDPMVRVGLRGETRQETVHRLLAVAAQDLDLPWGHPAPPAEPSEIADPLRQHADLGEDTCGLLDVSELHPLLDEVEPGVDRDRWQQTSVRLGDDMGVAVRGRTEVTVHLLGEPGVIERTQVREIAGSTGDPDELIGERRQIA